MYQKYFESKARSYWEEHSTKNKSKNKPVETLEVEDEENESTDDELLDDFKVKLQSAIANMSPAKFEQFSRALLTKMGVEFTMAHEASHHILSKMYAMPSEGRFHAEYDSERSYSKEELAQMFASVEWQADTMGASLLMPRRIIENALAKYNQSNPIRVYGDNTITSKDKAVIRRMAAYIGVSYTALVIRLRDMGLFEYHNILEYISNELNLGGVSQ